jgi:hypothetical protein
LIHAANRHSRDLQDKRHCPKFLSKIFCDRADGNFSVFTGASPAAGLLCRKLLQIIVPQGHIIFGNTPNK